ncbi:MAG: hypothetical protein LQ345_005248, partial [Seirophora villosa]
GSPHFASDTAQDSEAPPTHDPATVEAVQGILNRGSFKPMDLEEAQRVAVRLSKAANGPKHKRKASSESANNMSDSKRKSAAQFKGASKAGRWMELEEVEPEDQDDEFFSTE